MESPRKKHHEIHSEIQDRRSRIDFRDWWKADSSDETSSIWKIFSFTRITSISISNSLLTFWITPPIPSKINHWAIPETMVPWDWTTSCLYEDRNYQKSCKNNVHLVYRGLSCWSLWSTCVCIYIVYIYIIQCIYIIIYIYIYVYVYHVNPLSWTV